MSERFREFFRGAFRSKAEKVKTALGQTTADSIASQLEGSKPVDFDKLVGEQAQAPVSKIARHGELIDDESTK